MGKTGVEVSALALGGMFDTINNQLLLKQSLDWGVNFWDTAEVYGNGLSEEGYGRFFAQSRCQEGNIFNHEAAPSRTQSDDGGVGQVLEEALHGLCGFILRARYK